MGRLAAVAYGQNDVSQLEIQPYCRVSRDSKGRLVSVDRQDREIQTYASVRNIPLLEAIREEGSAVVGSKERPGWERIKRLARNRQIGGVIVWDISRAARDGWEGAQLIQIIREEAIRGFVIISKAEDETYRLDDIHDQIRFQEAINAASREGLKIQRRVRSGLHDIAAGGKLIGGPRRRFGFIDAYQNRHHTLEARLIREAASDWTRGGRILSQIARAWNEGGHKTAVQPYGEDEDEARLYRGGADHVADSVKDILMRPINAGLIMGSPERGAPKVVLGRLPGEPILQEATYNELVAFAAKRKRGGRTPSEKFLLSSLDLIYCAHCGTCMTTGQVRDRYLYYKCRYNPKAPGRKGCSNSIPSGPVEALVRDRALSWWSDDARIAALPSANLIGDIAAQVNSAEEALALWFLKKGTVSNDLWHRTESDLQGQLARLQAHLGRMEDDNPNARVVPLGRAVEMWEESHQQRQRMTVAAIKRITIQRAATGVVPPHRQSFDHARLIIDIR